MHITINFGLPVDPDRNTLIVDASGWMFNRPSLSMVPGQSGLLNDNQLQALDAYEEESGMQLPADRF